MHTSLSKLMSTFDQEQIWAAQLAKSKISAAPTNSTDWSLKAASIFRDISQTKKDLKAALLNQDTKKVEALLSLLIKLRAEQLRYTIQQYQRNTPKENPKDIARMIFAYKKDCSKLIETVQKMHS